jgi:ribosomal protein L7/L12
MNIAEAEKIVEEKVLCGKPGFKLIPNSTEEFRTCFAVYYQGKEYVETSDPLKMYVGHGPVIVSKASAEVFETGSAHPTKHYVSAFEACGDPMANPTELVRVFGWCEGAKKVSATKYIKSTTNLGLKSAKEVVDNALSNETTTVAFPSSAKASEAAKGLQERGFKCKQLWSNEC